MSKLDPSHDTFKQPNHLKRQFDPHRSSAIRVAVYFLIAGFLWILLTDFTLAIFGGFTVPGLFVSAGKGILFVVLSSAVVYWLCRREYRNTERQTVLLQAVVEGTTDAVFVKSRDGRYLLLNSAGAGLIGKPVAEVLGKKDSELFEAKEAETLMARDRTIMEGGMVVTIEETLTIGGSLHTYHTTKAPYMDHTGALAGLIGIGREITDRTLVESSLRETEARLREAQRIAKLGSWSWEPISNRVWWSDAEFELFGLDPEKTSPSFEAFLGLLHPDDRPLAIARVEAMRTGANEFGNDFRIVRSDGACIWIHSQARATRDSTGVLVRVEGTDQDITAQRLAREAVLESERRLQAAVEVAELGVTVVDYALQTAELSHRAAEQFGLQPGQRALRADLHSRFHPSDVEELTKLIDEALDPAGSGWFDLEHRVVRPDGTTRWLNVRKQVSFVDGRPHHAVVVTADVTDRRLADTRLREKEMLVREAAELAKVGGWGFDPVTFHSDWTPEVAQMYGVPPESPPDLSNALEFFSPDQRPALEAALTAAIQRGVPHDMELLMHAADGETKWVRTICRPIMEGDRVVRVRGSLQDITDRKRAEAELRESEERYRLLFESNPHPMWVYDVDSLCFLAVNDAAVLAYGYTREEFLKMTIRDIRPPQEVPQLELAVARTTLGRSHTMQSRHCRKDGSVIDVEVASHDLPNDQGRTRLVLALDITDRKRAESELLESERRLRLALESASAVAFVWDIPSDTVTRYYSTEPALPVTNERLGTFEEVRSRVHPNDLQSFDSRISECLANGTEYFNEYRVVRADGTTANLEDYGFLDRAADGTPLNLTGMVLDVTDRVVATEALRTSEARYRQLVDMLPTALFVHADNTILYGNPSFLRMIGATHQGEILGRRPNDVFHPSSHDVLQRLQQEMESTGIALPGCEMIGIRFDGRSVPVHVIAAPVEGYGRPATLVALSDLTERERTAALLRSVLDSVGDAIMTMDTLGSLTSANRATERLFGYRENELVGMNIRELIPDFDWGERVERFREREQSGPSRLAGENHEVEGRRQDEKPFPAELSITEFSRDGELEYTGVLRDLTARRQLEEQFRQAQKMEAIGRLAGGVAHDFNNLLTVINICSEMVLAGLTVDDPARGPLAAIHDAGDRAARLTQQLLAFSRKSMIEPKLVNLNELVSETAKLFRRLIGEDIALSVLVDPASVRVMIDPGQLEQVLMNLGLNARDAMPTGGRLTIETRAIQIEGTHTGSHPDLPPGRYALLRVSDTGCGMSRDVKNKIFEPFFTTKGLGKGTGLGLAVVHGIVQQSGGAIEVESTLGTGTTFHIYLPATIESEEKGDASVTTVAPRGCETILVVEDDETVRTVVRVALEEQGYTVLTASGGQEAFDLIVAQLTAVDLLVTDVIMPGISGRELAVAARKAQPHLRVLYMSGYTDDALDRHGLQDSVDQFIQKPLTPLGLARKVRWILDQPDGRSKLAEEIDPETGRVGEPD